MALAAATAGAVRAAAVVARPATVAAAVAAASAAVRAASWLTGAPPAVDPAAGTLAALYYGRVRGTDTPSRDWVAAPVQDIKMNVGEFDVRSLHFDAVSAADDAVVAPRPTPSPTHTT